MTVFLSGVLKQVSQRRLLATVADIDRVVVTLTASGQPDRSQIVSGAAIVDGQTSVTFDALPPGSYAISVRAYDVGGAVIGETNDVADVVAAQTTSVELSVVLVPSFAVPSGGGSGSSSRESGSLAARTSFCDGPVLLPPQPLLAALSFVDAFDAPAIEPVIDLSDNVWVAAPVLKKFAQDGTVLASVDMGNAVQALHVDPSGNVWVGRHRAPAPSGPGGLAKLAADGTVLLDGLYPDTMGLFIAQGPGPSVWSEVIEYGDGGAGAFKLVGPDGVELKSVDVPFTLKNFGYPMTSDPCGNLWFSNTDLTTDRWDGKLPGKVYRYDAASGVLKALDVGKGLISIAGDSYGRIWVGSQSEDGPNVTVLANSGAVLATIPLPAAPQRISFDRSGRPWCYLGDPLDDVFKHAVIDPQAFTVAKIYSLADGNTTFSPPAFDRLGHAWFGCADRQSPFANRVKKYAIQ